MTEMHERHTVSLSISRDQTISMPSPCVYMLPPWLYNDDDSHTFNSRPSDVTPDGPWVSSSFLRCALNVIFAMACNQPFQTKRSV